jgi:hypothetical protein
MMSQSHDQAEGERRKDEALDLLAHCREAVVRRAQHALLAVLLETGSATADDVRERVELPPGVGPKCFGAVPLPLVRAGIIRADGYAKTCRPTAHARPLTVWLLADRVAAVQWLSDHPDLEDTFAQSEAAVVSQGLLFPITTNEPGAAAATAAPGMEPQL